MKLVEIRGEEQDDPEDRRDITGRILVPIITGCTLPSGRKKTYGRRDDHGESLEQGLEEKSPDRERWKRVDRREVE